MNAFLTIDLLALAVTSFLFLVQSNSSFATEPLSSEEFEKLYKEGVLKDRYNAAVQRINEGERTAEILGFVCACGLMRDLTEDEYEVAKAISPGYYSCTERWVYYIRKSLRPVAYQLRELLKPREYRACGASLCSSGYKCDLHMHNNKKTVRVMSRYQAGVKYSIFDILKKEQPEFLLNLAEMKYTNIFANATDETAFPFYTFEKYKKKFAIPQVRSCIDMESCPAHLIKPSKPYEDYYCPNHFDGLQID